MGMGFPCESKLEKAVIEGNASTMHAQVSHKLDNPDSKMLTIEARETDITPTPRGISRYSGIMVIIIRDCKTLSIQLQCGALTTGKI